jgi:hypothetical protein
VNYELELDQYEKIIKSYNKDLRRNLKEAKSHGSLCIDVDENVMATIDLFKDVYHRKYQINDGRYQNLHEAFSKAILDGKGKNFVVKDEANRIMARAFLLFNHRYVHYILAAPTHEGRDRNVMHYFIDEFIKSHCGKGLVFDFEGSDMPNVAHFYRKFNPMVKHYYLKNIWLFAQIMNRWSR